MSEYFGENNTIPKKNNHILGLLAGIGVGIVVAILLAVITILVKAEYYVLDICAILVVGYIISRFVPNKSGMGFITGALSCGIMYFSYSIICLFAGYWYDDGDYMFWIGLIGSIIYGGIMGYRGKSEFDTEAE